MNHRIQTAAGVLTLSVALPAAAQLAASAPVPCTRCEPDTHGPIEPTLLVGSVAIALVVGLAIGYALGRLSALSRVVDRLAQRDRQ